MKMKAAILGFALSLFGIPAFAAVFVVDSVGDEPDADVTDGICQTAVGTCTLRAAIEQANALAGADAIHFNIPGPGVHTISPATLLPALTDDAGLTIDGYTQTGSSPNTLIVGDNARLTIEIDGTTLGQSGQGLQLGGKENVLRGIVINSFDGIGLNIFDGFGQVIQGCFIGTDATGTSAKANLVGILSEPGTSPLTSPPRQPPRFLTSSRSVAVFQRSET